MIKVISSYDFIFRLSTTGHVFYRTDTFKKEKSAISMAEIADFYLFVSKFYSFYPYSWEYLLYYKKKFNLKFII